MTDTTKTEALADKYAERAARTRLESLYGTSKSYTAECLKRENEARAELIRAISAVEAERDELRRLHESTIREGAKLLDADLGNEPRAKWLLLEISRVVTERDRLAAECEALRVVLRQAKAALNTARVTILTDDGAVDGTPKVVLAAVSAIDAAMGGNG